VLQNLMNMFATRNISSRSAENLLLITPSRKTPCLGYCLNLLFCRSALKGKEYQPKGLKPICLLPFPSPQPIFPYKQALAMEDRAEMGFKISLLLSFEHENGQSRF